MGPPSVGPPSVGFCVHIMPHVVGGHFCSYTGDEIHFNLMAIVADRKKLYEKQIEEFSEKRDAAAQRVSAYSIV